MNLKLSAGLFAILLFVSSCEKEFNDLGASLLPSDTFVIEKETAPVGLGHKSIEIVRTDNLSFFSLGEYEDAAFGNTKASFTTQLSLATSSTGTFGSMSPATETNGVTSDTTNKNPHDEQETVDSIWINPTEALRRNDEKEFDLMRVTRMQLEWLTEYANKAELLETVSNRKEFLVRRPGPVAPGV